MMDNPCQNVLIVDNDSQATRVVLETLAGAGIRGTVALNLPTAMERLGQLDWDLIVLDVGIPGGSAFQFLRKAREDYPELPVVMVSGEASIPDAVRAMREGCRDFLVKSLRRETIEGLIETLLPNHDVAMAVAEEEDNRCLLKIAGRSEAFLEVLRLAGKIAPTSVPVLITGESGTGKELISYYLHRHSHRASGPYIRVNCASLSESLLESELFGHERGAFTGAYSRRKGRFERAHGGTLLLDEISETGPRLQAELLRVLEQQDFERLGGSEMIRVNVRVICTSNRDLAVDVEQGRFRRDLYYRIRGFHLHVPPLRERKEDIPVLTWHFVNQYAREVRRRIAELDAALVEAFRQHDWPGNVRELRNAVRSALILGSGPLLSLEDFDGFAPRTQPAEAATAISTTSLSLEDLERRAILEALRRTKSHQAKAARILGISDRTLREKLRRYRQAGQLQTVGEELW
jgi:DNA-binding NtrC family response regulator